MLRLGQFALIFGVSFWVTSCSLKKDNSSSEIANAKTLLNQYIESNYPNLQPTASGLYYISLKDGTGAQPDTGDYALINYTGWLIDGTTVVATSDSALIATANNLYSSSCVYGTYKIKVGYAMSYIIVPQIVTAEGVEYMKQGGISKMIVPYNLAYGANSVGSIPAYSSLIYTVELVEVIKDPVARENRMITQYIDSLRTYKFFAYDTIDSIDNGLIYIEKEKGTGKSPADYSIVEMKYTARFLDGRIFSSSGDSSAYQLKESYPLLTGLDQGLKLMSKGSRALLVIPYDLGFGSDGYVIVPPYQTLLYDIQVLNVYTHNGVLDN